MLVLVLAVVVEVLVVLVVCGRLNGGIEGLDRGMRCNAGLLMRLALLLELSHSIRALPAEAHAQAAVSCHPPLTTYSLLT